MKKKFLFVLFLGFLFISCGDKPYQIPEEPDVPETPVEPDESNPSNNQDNPGETDKNLKQIMLENNSSYSVSVYFQHNPETGVPVFAEIPPKETVYKDVELNELDEDGSVFYFIYNLKIGSEDVLFPYYPEDNTQNHKIINLIKDDKVIIDDIKDCKTQSSYLFLENNTSSNIMLKLKYTRIKPYHKEDELLQIGETGVYEIGGSSASFLRDLAGEVKLEADTNQYSLPEIEYEPGKIYTVTVSNNTEAGAKEKITASLKAISPFNIDTEKKMWSRGDSDFVYDWNKGIKPVVKPAFNKDDGFITMGTLKSDKKWVGISKINQYGQASEPKKFSTAIFVDKTTNVNYLDTLTMVDFVEQSDGSVVMLLTCSSKEDADGLVDRRDILVAYNFDNKMPLWYYEFPDLMLFRNDSANKLIRLDDNKLAVVGAVVDTDETSESFGCFSPYAGVFDYTKKSDDGLSFVRNEEGCKSYIMEEKFENESVFSSAYYDGTNIYVCGFTNFDAEYSNVIHKGIVYKFDADLSNAAEIYSKDKCIFFTISGNGSKWYTCGEYWKQDAGKLLGCYVSSSMIAKDKETNPAYYFGKKANAWFNQLCTYDNMIVLCGQSSEDMNGEKAPLPFVLAYDAEGKILWENLSYEKWATALNIIPNTIGTYILQLTDSNNSQVYYVSADLLGKEVVK